ncbi:hypothetical protein L208DRAFT_184020 [Tricholoma matsutake]|nr:hypothetical protein L208DRAFT_184020 [Tricholoma matsutake 945]
MYCRPPPTVAHKVFVVKKLPLCEPLRMQLPKSHLISPGEWFFFSFYSFLLLFIFFPVHFCFCFCFTFILLMMLYLEWKPCLNAVASLLPF